jgi:hypothetical protein
MGRFVDTCINDKILDEMIELFILLLRELEINNRDRLLDIIGKTDRERDTIFHDFVYPENDNSEYDPRRRIFVLYENPERREILKSAVDIVLNRISSDDIPNVINSRENLESYLILFHQFIDYLYLDRNNPNNEGMFSYDADNNRVHIIERHTGGIKDTRKRKRKTKTKKTKTKKRKK